MTICVVTHPIQDVGVRFYATKERVARRAKRTAHRTGDVVVVHEEIAGHATDQAPVLLRGLEFVNLLRRKTVLALVAGAQILRLRSVRVLATPLSKALVATIGASET